ncbi:hypothetical protein [Candidatus Mycoplasma haematominutum]|uniref:Uncharacterized protein n=1 Tax=Candidatus Mycoplasma haematominutum 'Birmingham 1' TaxID=1116213 RepID=G8C3B4_9MOLU|nr:hypothetical protein [Candidatus Mycoplasma haematominutum]CCE66812.1 hypothetical protein MHM_02940 [Candidatus Mycoplasma haematominutum 'Birmingham 1']
MSFWELFSQWQGGAAFATVLAAIPILSIFALSSQGRLNITGWESSTFHGLYSRVKLFIKNNGGSQQNGTADLVAQVPLSELGNYSKYKWCISDSSKLKKTVSEPQTSVSAETTGPKCELQYFSVGSSENQLESGVASYLLETITKYLEVQHVANMFVLYDKNTQQENKSSNGAVTKIANACKISKSDAFEVVKELFLGSEKWSKNCLMSPIIVDLELKLNGSTSTTVVTQTAETTPSASLTKEKLQSGTLSGRINYGIFDYSSYKKLKEIPSSNNGGNKNYSLKINWPIPYKLSSPSRDNTDPCSLEKLHEKTRKRELKWEDIKSCISSVS